jgi:acyl-CoA synthetase (AMP-forming)/AMP-acid ligase II
MIASYEPLTLDAYIAHFAAHAPEAEMAVHGGMRLTYAESETLVARLAGWLRAHGIQPGDRVGVLSTPRPEYFIALNAILRAGAIYVGLNPRHTAPEMAYAIRLTGPVVILGLGSALGIDLAATLADAIAAAGLSPTVVPFDTLDDLARLKADPVMVSVRGLQDPAVIVFTSGTTGKPKGATLHHSGLIQSAISQYEHLAVDGQRMLSNLPINHVGCILNLGYGVICGGGTLVFQEKFDPGEALALIESEKLNVWLQVPAMFQMVTTHPDFLTRNLTSLQAICAGGGALPAPTLKALRSTGARIYVEYGQTEIMSTLAFADHDASDEELAGTIGRFDPRFEVRIADETNCACAAGETGEIQAYGDCVMKGYWSDPAATAAGFTSDGWWKTGDLAAMRADGLVELKGRLTEMIKSGGYNLYPREIEMALEGHDAVDAVVVIGLADATFGEAAHAVIVFKAGSRATHQDLKAWCARRLANYKTPRSFRVIDHLPRLPNGKVDRSGLKAAAPTLPLLS